MSEQIPFQYAILRFTHDVETGEYVNVGLAIYSPQAKFFKVRILTRYRRLTDMFPGVDGEFYKRYATRLQTTFDQIEADLTTPQTSFFEHTPDQIGELLKSGLPINETTIQFSMPKFGITDDPAEMFEYLFERLVERYTKGIEQSTRTDEQVWAEFRRPLLEQRLLMRLHSTAIATPRERFTFEHTWKNGTLNVLYPQSFDLVIPTNIRQKARTLIGTATILNEYANAPHLYVLLGRPRGEKDDVERAYVDARGMLEDQGEHLNLEIVEEDKASAFVEEIKPLIEQSRD